MEVLDVDTTMKIGGIYYTDSQLDPKILNICQDQLRKAFDESKIVCVSLNTPMKFGKNIVFEGKRSYPTYLREIMTALQNSDADVVYFLEHDVLYHPSHFDFVPEDKSIYYYNINNYRWRYMTEIAVTYDGLSSLSGMCCYRDTAIKHYAYRIKVMEDQKLEEDRAMEPRWARRFGYEPGTKPKRRGGITDEICVKRMSAFPNVDIRHKRTFSKPKTFASEFNHLPPTFREVNIKDIPDWDLKKMFNL
jgi:hypothetical protein